MPHHATPFLSRQKAYAARASLRDLELAGRLGAVSRREPRPTGLLRLSSLAAHLGAVAGRGGDMWRGAKR